MYVVIGFEFIQLFIKTVQHSFKYQINLSELYYREQWIDKGFIINISKFIFDLLVLGLDIKLFMWIFLQGQFPLYLLGNTIDTFIKLYKSVQLFLKSTSLVSKLNQLPDVDFTTEEARQGRNTTCIICLEEM